ncbi:MULTISPECIES: tyrosine recombinase XerS [unclassified Lactobacillus]|uniref:tyrosine recombinase XerS n=1 Tax=unclassified Lactobacillus TaxID=2620435 RepID=UPI000EFBFD7C|nr:MULTISPECIES: tyrosine recombinase XerS [unclassified Lactobacillus]RMC24618.1 tyrosine recombinase XerS [Lactobacillus sp. ESL0247]RMC28890.1 tyrosine recombinase XerS [Lactobacillus sp. ESL0246]RMC32135.1 tyrosine recombinase XerS [Lactobacillus sp. ESL0245]RMC48780.1 tyrosine recombinase XerS [Lactobacillus sp. ESL0228]
METNKYLNLIQTELQNMPDYIKEYNFGTNHSLATSYQYLTEIRRFFDWLRTEGISRVNNNKQVTVETLANLHRNDIMLYINYLGHTKNQQGHLNSPTTINRSINALRSLFKFLTITADNNDGQPYFERNVMLKIDSLNDTKTLNYRAHVLESHMYIGNLKYQFLDFIENEYEQRCNKQALPSFKVNKQRDIAIIALILGTGIRVSECAGINVADLNLRKATLDVTRKGGQRDSVPIAEWTLDYLIDYKKVRKQRYNVTKRESALFLTNWHQQTKRITSNAIEKMVNKYSAAFGHPLTPHKLRHTLASELYGVTKDQVLVAQQLGQKGTTATDLYTHVDQTKQRQALNDISANDDPKQGN